MNDWNTGASPTQGNNICLYPPSAWLMAIQPLSFW